MDVIHKPVMLVLLLATLAFAAVIAQGKFVSSVLFAKIISRSACIACGLAIKNEIISFKRKVRFLEI